MRGWGGGVWRLWRARGGWWLLVAILLAGVDFPVALPVGDLSRVVKGGSERVKGGNAV